MKKVLLQLDGQTPQWNPLFADCLLAIGVIARGCRASTPQTTGKVERSSGGITSSLWPGIRFTDRDDRNRQARAWCDRRNQGVQATPHARPRDRWGEEGVRPLPQGFAWEHFRQEERRVTSDRFVSFDGVLYGLPGDAALTGRVVQVGVRHFSVRVQHQGQLMNQHQARPLSGTQVLHPEQCYTVPPARTHQQTPVPLGHQVAAMAPARRSLADYDQVCDVVLGEVAA